MRSFRLVWSACLVGSSQPALRRVPGFRGWISRGQRGTIMLHRCLPAFLGGLVVFLGRLAILLEVENPAQIYVTPGQHVGIVNGLHSLLKGLPRFIHLSRASGNSSQNKSSPARLFSALIVLGDVQGKLLGALDIARRELSLRYIQQVGLRRPGPRFAHYFRRRLGGKNDRPGALAFPLQLDAV